MPNIVKKTTPEQMAFDIFEKVRLEKAPGTSITQASSEIGYRKTNILLDVTSLGLVPRRAINAIWFLAAQSPHQEAFDADLQYFKWLAKYETSNNHQHLRKVLRECQKAAVQVLVEMPGAEPQWAAVPLVGTVAIAGGRVAFKVDELIRRQLDDPKSYTFLSIRIAAALSQYAYVLYERLGALAFKGTTDWIPLAEVRRWVNADAVASLTEYKNFKRLVLDKSIAQINEITDLRVDYETRTIPGTRRIDALRFRLSDNPNGKLVLDMSRAHELKDLYETLVNGFGLGPQHIQEILDGRSEFTDERIRAAIELTRYRTKQGKVKNPGLYLMKAIRDGLRLGDEERTVAEQAQSAPALVAPAVLTAKLVQMNGAVKSESEKGVAAYLALGDAQRAQALATLRKEATFKAALRRVKLKEPSEDELLANAVLRSELGIFAARRLKAVLA